MRSIQRGAEDHQVVLPSGHSLVFRGRGGRARYTAEGASAGGVIELSGTFPKEGQSDGIVLDLDHSLSDITYLFVPHLTPTEGDVMGDFVFRSPAVVVADPSQAMALVVDVDDVRDMTGCRAWLDYDNLRGRVTLAAGAYSPTGHVFFKREKVGAAGQCVRLRLHVVTSTDPKDIANPYGMAARWLWNRWGHAGWTSRTEPPFERWTEHVTRLAFDGGGWSDSVWQSLDLDGEPAGAPVFIVDVAQHPSVPPQERRWRERRSIWNQAWFSTQRCANGLLRYARQVKSTELENRARLMTRIALAAPQNHGLFPSVLTTNAAEGWAEPIWTSSDRRPPSASAEACHLVDAAVTCRMLLDWHAMTSDETALARTLGFAERLASLAMPSGAFPGWVEPNGRIPEELKESAETAVGVSLLFDLTLRHECAPGLRDAAFAGTRFLENVIRESRWEDFETYYSCAPWGNDSQLGARVLRNGVFKQNTLSIFWCAEAMLRAWKVSGEARYLDLAIRCVDELSLYQAVWSPPFLTAPAHGGFGVMNGDCEWNDARQSLFAPLYFELHEHTGETEYLERGASALMASFSLLYCPENPVVKMAYERRFPFFGEESYGFMMENQGHGANDDLGTFSIFSWGGGSALASVAEIRDRFPESYRRAFLGG